MIFTAHFENKSRKNRLRFPQIKNNNPLYESPPSDIESDVLGSYTGTPTQADEPQQDADDL